MRKIRLALAGVGGFGRVHVASAELLVEEGLVSLEAFCEPDETALAVGALREKGARHYRDFSAMLDGEPDLDAVCISTPIPDHVPMTLAAFERGLHVFVEKPPCVRIQDLSTLVAAQHKADRLCAVGFHDVARPEVQLLKRALCGGAVGRITRITGEARLARSESYYRRTPWAGKLLVNGQYTLDGPMNNACAHVLNLAAFLAGGEPHTYAVPEHVRGELYRANVIESEDTNCLRAAMDNGVEICIHTTQCAAASHPRTWTVDGTRGTARLHDTEGVTLPGETIPADEKERPHTTLLRRFVDVVSGNDEPLINPLDEMDSFVLLSNGAYESAGTIRTIPEPFLTRETRNDGPAVVVKGIEDLMAQAAADGKLLSECEVPWAVATPSFPLKNYESFPQRWAQ